MLSELTDLRIEELQAKLEECKKALCGLLGVKEQNVTSNNFSFEVETHSSHMTVKKNMPIGKENRTPFRNLFAEGE